MEPVKDYKGATVAKFIFEHVLTQFGCPKILMSDHGTVLVAWELPKDSQFPSVSQDLPDPAKYALLWVTRDVQQIKESKIFWILMEMNIWMGINCK